jgi:hypothetical protein
MSSLSKPRRKEPSAKDLHRMLLSSLKKVGERATLGAEWIAGDTTERYFDYVRKKAVKADLGRDEIGAEEWDGKARLENHAHFQ